MRVLMLSWEYPPVIEGGLGRHVHTLAERLASAGVDLHVLTRDAGGAAADQPQRGLHVDRVAQPAFPGDVERFVEWVRTMNTRMAALGAALTATRDFDLVHSHDWLVADAARRLARDAGRPWLVTVHATEHGRHQGRVEQRPQSLIHAAERAMAREADHVITCSEYMAGEVARVFGVAPQRITTIPNGLDAADPATPAAAPAEIAALRARHARPHERLVLMAGRLVYEKGFHLALEALAALAGGRDEVRFVIAGSGPAEAELRSQAQRLGLGERGAFLGWTEDQQLRSLYRVCDVCVVPSLYEPFGLVALEAMASGCPCVIADTGGLRELIPAEAREAGLCFAADDAVALSEAIERALAREESAAHAVAKARERALSMSSGEMARRTLAVYDALTARPLPVAAPRAAN